MKKGEETNYRNKLESSYQFRVKYKVDTTRTKARSNIVAKSKNQPQGNSQILNNVMVLFPTQVQLFPPTMALVTPGNILLLCSLPDSLRLIRLASFPNLKPVALFHVLGHKLTAIQGRDLFSGPKAQVTSDSCKGRNSADGTKRISMRREFDDICMQSTFN